jgi:hypothetical protein
MRIRIRFRIVLLIKVMGICDHWFTDYFEPPCLHCERSHPPRLYFEPLQLFTLMRIQLAKIMRIQADPDLELWLINIFFSRETMKIQPTACGKSKFIASLN